MWQRTPSAIFIDFSPETCIKCEYEVKIMIKTSAMLLDERSALLLQNVLDHFCLI